MSHGKGSVIGQLTAVEYNRLTISDTVLIDQPAGEYIEIREYRTSARGHLIDLFRNAHGNGGSFDKLTVESSSTTSF